MRTLLAILLLSFFTPLASAQENLESKEWQDYMVVENQEGEFQNLAYEYADKNILLFFWAEWCHYCRKTLPSINRLAKEFEAKYPNFIVMPVSISQKGIGPAKKYFKRNGFNNLKPYHDTNNALFARYGGRGVPYAALLSKGKLIQKISGQQDYDGSVMRELIANIAKK